MEQKNKSTIKTKISNFINVILITAFSIFIILFGIYQYVFNFEKTKLFSQSSPEEKHTLEFFEKGTPFFVGESEIQIKYNGNRINLPIANDGMNLSENNVSVLWKDEDHATIYLSGQNQITQQIEFDADERKKFISK